MGAIVLAPEIDVLFRYRDGTYRVDPTLLYPPFLERLARLLTVLLKAGRGYYLTSGLRWYAEQEALHKKYLAGGPRAVAGGFSAHQYGIAVDLAPDADPSTPGLQGPDYSQAAYAPMIGQARALGLKPGADFGDNPHVQAPRFVTGKQLATLRDIFLDAPGNPLDKLRAVWAYLDKNLYWAPLELPPLV